MFSEFSFANIQPISNMKVENSQAVKQVGTLGNHSVHTQATLTKLPPSKDEIQTWIVSYLSDLLEVDPEEVDITIPFDRYGLDASAAIGLTGELEDWLGSQVDPTLLYDYPTVEGLVQHLNSTLTLQN